MSIEINKIDDELACYIFICDDTGKKMINVWPRTIGDDIPTQTVEAKWSNGVYSGSGRHDIKGVLSCTPIENSRLNTEISDFITDEIQGDVKLTAFVSLK